MNYTKESALKMIRENGLRIRIDDDSIHIPIGKIVGNKLWGAIDYLVKQHGYIYFFEEKHDAVSA